MCLEIPSTCDVWNDEMSQEGKHRKTAKALPFTSIQLKHNHLSQVHRWNIVVYKQKQMMATVTGICALHPILCCLFYFLGFWGRSLFQTYQHLFQAFAFWRSFEIIIWTNCDSKKSKVNTGHSECSEADSIKNSQKQLEVLGSVCVWLVGCFFGSRLLRSINETGPIFGGDFSLDLMFKCMVIFAGFFVCFLGWVM